MRQCSRFLPTRTPPTAIGEIQRTPKNRKNPKKLPRPEAGASARRSKKQSAKLQPARPIGAKPPSQELVPEPARKIRTRPNGPRRTRRTVWRLARGGGGNWGQRVVV